MKQESLDTIGRALAGALGLKLKKNNAIVTGKQIGRAHV